jgi:hypothetical protein
MAKSVRMQPMSRAKGKMRLIPITDSCWKKIEAKYGKELSKNVRQRIVDAMNEYLCSVDFERNAIPAKKATTLIASIKAEANKLQASSNKLRELLSTSGEQTGFYVQHLIREYFHADNDPTLGMYSPAPNGLVLEPDDQLFHVLRKALFPLSNVNPDGVLDSLISACEMALSADDDEKDHRPFRAGSAWEAWICSLTAIAESNGLPWKVSKGHVAPDKASPFIRLVIVLQEHIPRGARQHTHSMAAFSKAISDIPNRKNGTNKSKPLKKVSRSKRS